MLSNSPKYTLNGVDLLKALRSFAVVAVSAGVLFLLNTVEPQLVGALPAKYSLILPVVTFVVEMLRRWATDHAQY